MKILDLFCCCGGASMGLSDNGNNEVVGVDITNDHQYPFEFIHSNVFDLPLSFFQNFDIIWASPPCQHYIPTNKWRGNAHPDLIEPTRELLKKTRIPYVIENVPNAPIRKDLLLCGEMFNGLRVIRHRIFEFGNGFNRPFKLPHRKHKINILDGSAVGVYTGGINPGFFGNKKKQEEFQKKRKDSYYACVAGHGGNGFSFTLKDWQTAMGIDWITKKPHLAQAIPPAYSNYIITNKVPHVSRLEDFISN